MNRIKELRIAEGISQQKLAQAIGTTQRNISYLESGIEISAQFASRIANFFDVTVDYLLGLEDDFGIRVERQKKEPDTLSAEERRLVEGYREINAAGKKLVMQTVETLLNSSAGSGTASSKNKIDG